MAFQDFIRNLGSQNAPFGFDAMPMTQAPSQDDPAFRSGMQFIGDVGMGMLASNSRYPLQAFGQAYLGAQQNARERNKNDYLVAQTMTADADKRRTREKQEALTNKWTEFATNNRDKFGQYAEFAPYLEPAEGLKLLSGMKPEWRPASAQEKAAYGVDPSTPLVIGQGGEPKILGAGGTTINMPAGETAFEKESAQAQAKRFDGIIQGGDEASRMMGDIEALKDIGSMIKTGKGAQALAALGPYAEALGIEIAGLGEMQAYEAISARVAPSLRTPGVGASSDFDARQFLKAIPSLANDPVGNQIISNTLEAVSQHKIAAAEIASAAMRGEISRADAERQIRALPNPWALWKRVSGRYSTTTPTPQANGVAVPDVSTMSDDDLLKALGR